MINVYIVFYTFLFLKSTITGQIVTAAADGVAQLKFILFFELHFILFLSGLSLS